MKRMRIQFEALEAWVAWAMGKDLGSESWHAWFVAEMRAISDEPATVPAFPLDREIQVLDPTWRERRGALAAAVNGRRPSDEFLDEKAHDCQQNGDDGPDDGDE